MLKALAETSPNLPVSNRSPDKLTLVAVLQPLNHRIFADSSKLPDSR